jgi:uncharacterized membrane protein SpoIIM required for sporulation
MPRWHELDKNIVAERAAWSLPASSISRLASLYRAACADLMRARRLGCTPDLIRYLDDLVARAHHSLYSASAASSRSLASLLLTDFPRAVRKNRWLVLSAMCLFWLPFAIGVVGALGSEDFASRVLPADQLEQLSESFGHGLDGRSESEDAAMAGFYVYNNVGIALRCFATGILYGLGSVFFLVYNGVVTGAVFGHVARLGHLQNLLTFVCGHGTFELTAIVFSGAAGLRLGQSLIDTEGRTRLGSLRRHSRELVSMVVGVAAMLLIAAGIEGFWSPSAIPRPVKYAVSAATFLVLLAFFLIGGRERRQGA